ncbi:Amidase [Corchorus olitorius]|uniref:Amidase n=1 Tax=Corchorus olitorius TaxID=93759 RepID=A0A1R3IXE5_9ROSI|nr:Amidase [Corchorus olitorius]
MQMIKAKFKRALHWVLFGAVVSNAPAVLDVLRAGATCVGKTIMDEMAYSINGVNVHYGTPTNPCAPDRVPGGSSSGSAIAVGASLVDFSLVTPMAQSFDTVGRKAIVCGSEQGKPVQGWQRKRLMMW